MKKRFIVCILIIMTLFNGCRNKLEQQLLSYQDFNTSNYYNDYLYTSVNDFISKDIAVITEEDIVSNDVKINAKAALLVNTTQNKAIYGNNVYEKLYPASLTKLLTALVVLKYGELSDQVTFSYNATHISEIGAKLCGFKEGDIISLDALLYSMLIYSGNDSSIALAEHIAGTEVEFVKLMNQEAKSLGATHSNFVNSHGLHDDNQYSTAYDLYLIFSELMGYDTFRSIININSYQASYKDIAGNDLLKTFVTTNKYLTNEVTTGEGITVLGGKTGTTSRAGYCLILLSRDSDETEYISVILKANDSYNLYSQMSHLLSYENN